MKTPAWIEKAQETFRFHRSRLLLHEKWTIEQTANSLDMSKGAVSEDLKIARWHRTHKEEIEKCEYRKDALVFIRKEEKKRDLE